MEIQVYELRGTILKWQQLTYGPAVLLDQNNVVLQQPPCMFSFTEGLSLTSKYSDNNSVNDGMLLVTNA
jgi:hypothetical protein